MKTLKTLFGKLYRAVTLLSLNYGLITRFDGIAIADCKSKNQKTGRFPELILAALQLLKTTDPKRYSMVCRRIDWISNEVIVSRAFAQYRHSHHLCRIDFEDPQGAYSRDYLVAFLASTIVHEATHGVIESRGIRYTPELRSRIEHLCFKQEQKFMKRLAETNPGVAGLLDCEFDPSLWEKLWHPNKWENSKLALRRILLPEKETSK